MRKHFFAALTILTVAFGSLTASSPANAANDNVYHSTQLDYWGAGAVGPA
jgi:hypothetical protein